MMVELPHSPPASASSIPVHESLDGQGLLACGAQGKHSERGEMANSPPNWVAIIHHFLNERWGFGIPHLLGILKVWYVVFALQMVLIYQSSLVCGIPLDEMIDLL